MRASTRRESLTGRASSARPHLRASCTGPRVLKAVPTRRGAAINAHRVNRASGQRLARGRASDSYENGAVTIRTEGLTHIHLAVRDLDQSLRFYRGVFGMEEIFREGEGMIFLRTPGAADTVTLRRSASSDDRPGDGGGIGHFGFRLVDEEDLDRAVEEVELAGGRLVRRGEHPDGQPFAYVTDPNGYVIEL
jgi:catechol 2,3-dioxygenase-like lactoylglutathione lyase family enzyme